MIKLSKRGALFVRDENGPVTIKGQDGSLFYTTTNKELWMLPDGNFVEHKLTPCEHKYTMRVGVFHPDKNTGRIIITGHYPLFYAHGHGRVWLDHRGRFHQYELAAPWTLTDGDFETIRRKLIKKVRPIVRRTTYPYHYECANCHKPGVARSSKKIFCSVKCNHEIRDRNKSAMKHMSDSGGVIVWRDS